MVCSLLHSGFDPGDIMVIAFHQAQITGLKQILRISEVPVTGTTATNTQVKVVSVEGSQGHERSIVIVEFVMSGTPASFRSSCRFLCDKYRLNVALSRAKLARIIIAHASFGLDVPDDSESNLIVRCQRRIRRFVDYHVDALGTFTVPHGPLQYYEGLFQPEKLLL